MARPEQSMYAHLPPHDPEHLKVDDLIERLKNAVHTQVYSELWSESYRKGLRITELTKTVNERDRQVFAAGVELRRADAKNEQLRRRLDHRYAIELPDIDTTSLLNELHRRTRVAEATS